MTEITTTDSTPKQQALNAAASIKLTATGLVEFRSEGRLVIIGNPRAVNSALEKFKSDLQIHCVYTDKPADVPDEDKASWFAGSRATLNLTGHLGAFALAGASGVEPISRFDLVLDLCEAPLFGMLQKPLGYFAPGDDEDALTEALGQLPDMIGRFEKPQFFDYNPDICAHGASGLEGCRQCIDTCPTEAIISIGEKVEVNPKYCQGGGICTSVCPTGAMTYRYPTAEDTLARLKAMITSYSAASAGKRPVLVFYGQEAEVPLHLLEDDELPVGLEELAGVGIEVWLSALCYGAKSVRLISDDGITQVTRNALEQQRMMCNRILTGLGYPEAVFWFEDMALVDEAIEIPGATFSGSGGKRSTLFMALDFLATHATELPESITLDSASPLGNVIVDKQACTLCMACTSVCPAAALADGGDRPALRFFESNCVQCGLCASACPEKAITLQPRLLLDAQERRKSRTLYEEEPFCCISCGKAFATRSVIETMMSRLAGHHMFQEESAKNRLKMCDDCRVADMIRSGGMDKIV